MRPDLAAAGNILFVDVETTGLTHADRMVTLGLVAFDAAAHAEGAGPGAVTALGHVIFNPGRPSNPFAAAVHGYDDWTLRHQDSFADHAHDLYRHFVAADCVVAHNASFDERFIRTAFADVGLTLAPDKFACTMRGWRARHGSPAGLDPVIQRLGLKARGKEHGALDDAFYCLQAYLNLAGHGLLPPPDGFRALADRPSNYVEPEMKPLRGQRLVRSL